MFVNATLIYHLVCSSCAHRAVVLETLCVTENVTENVAIWIHEATVILLKENVWGIVCANGREGFANAFVIVAGLLETESAKAW